jgi:hypothetical protein
VTTVDEIVMETGGFRVGRNAWLSWHASWGFGVLEISRERLVLDTTWSRYSFTVDAIVCLSPTGGLWRPGVRIEHRVETYPPYIVFVTFHVARVANELRAAGYSVDDRKA